MENLNDEILNEVHYVNVYKGFIKIVILNYNFILEDVINILKDFYKDVYTNILEDLLNVVMDMIVVTFYYLYVNVNVSYEDYYH